MERNLIRKKYGLLFIIFKVFFVGIFYKILFCKNLGESAIESKLRFDFKPSFVRQMSVPAIPSSQQKTGF